MEALYAGRSLWGICGPWRFEAGLGGYDRWKKDDGGFRVDQAKKLRKTVDQIVGRYETFIQSGAQRQT